MILSTVDNSGVVGGKGSRLQGCGSGACLDDVATATFFSLHSDSWLGECEPGAVADGEVALLSVVTGSHFAMPL